MAMSADSSSSDGELSTEHSRGQFQRQGSTVRPAEDRRAGAKHSSFLPLMIGAVGVVFGDIGTSPLYTFNSIYSELHALPSPQDVRQAFSVIFWTMTWMTCFKYLGLCMRVSHYGEGGTFAMMKVILQKLRDDGDSESEQTDEEAAQAPGRLQRMVLLLGMLSCAMLVGDGVITPPNSVLGALNAPCLKVDQTWNMVIAVLILIGLFSLQRVGSSFIGVLAGPVMLLWFLTIAALGVYQMVLKPELAAFVAHGFNPVHVYEFFVTGHYKGFLAFKAIAGVVLCVTGAEALYADMGHFGAGPISAAWFVLVYPCLILQYMGQAVVIIQQPRLVDQNPFYSTAPDKLMWPVFILAALAAVLASQALISGVFTLMSQAHALGMIPRLLIVHTNPDEKGQVYVPEINWMLMLACILVTVAFRTSDALVSAYGIAVTGAFIFTTILLIFVFHFVWGWWWPFTVAIILPMLAIDLIFWSANLLKLFESGWVPLALSASIFLLLYIHNWGRIREEALRVQEKDGTLCTLEGLQRRLAAGDVARPVGTAFFMSAHPGRVPPSISVLINELSSVPRNVVLLHVAYSDDPFVLEMDRVSWATVDHNLGLHTATLHFGYAEPLTSARFDLTSNLAFLTRPEIPAVGHQGQDTHAIRTTTLDASGNLDLEAQTPDPRVTFIVNRKHFVAGDESCRTRAFTSVFSTLNRNSVSPITFFGLDAQNVLEVSKVVQL